jgi:hypothetical protein
MSRARHVLSRVSRAAGRVPTTGLYVHVGALAGLTAAGAAAAASTTPTRCRQGEGGRGRALDTCAQQLLPSFLLGAAVVACANHIATCLLAATNSCLPCVDAHILPVG